MRFTYLASPIGPLLLAGEGEVLAALGFAGGPKARGPAADWVRDDAILREAREQLAAYFAGERRTFELELKPAVTGFRARVLKALLAIPYGETRSYKEVALALGNAAAVRAVGSANGSNPIPVVIPCHRVIGSNGALTGFGGGLERKRFLLDLERRHSGLFSGRAGV